ncbi:MAG: DUF4870 domain-containing protein [Melioribacteraceae bacterium]|nr:DUF4870 domain-containing protein [Melioribacteraceae bacterium]MCF8356528.1 DUF4870 domain-containing protein [Melioribacteraceae bacterium]MCF8395917.1 DUF4870 domain-containing protein [Melioribacteraceae bacterium]MCF8420975.1 DUF4870 domain-containing protein [Melioribacteraceae bacterium]
MYSSSNRNIELNREERMWGMLCHISAFAFFIFPFGHIIGPLVIWLIKREQFPFVDDQGKEVLNFQISITIYSTVALIFSFVLIGIPFLIAFFLIDFVSVIIGAIKANDGIYYRYPFSINFVR